MTATTSSSQTPRKARRRVDGGVPGWVGWMLALVPGVAARLLVGAGFFNFEQLIAALLAGFVLILIAAHPARSVSVLLVLLPFQLMLTSLVYDLGVGGGVTRMGALWKELVVLGVVVAAWRRSLDRGKGQLDALDRVAIAFTLLGTIYFAIPEGVASELGSALSIDTRFLAWRFVVLPAVLLLACRRLRLSDEELRWVLRGSSALAALLGVVAVVEFAASDAWNSLLVDTIGVNRYRIQVLDLDLVGQGLSAFDVRVYGEVAGRLIIRAGGPMVSHLTFSFVLLIALAVVVERLVRADVTPAVLVGLLGCGAGLLFTQTRSSIVGACVLLVVAFRPAPGRSVESRVRYGLLAAAVVVVALPLALGAGLGDRFTEGDEFSESVHEDRVALALDAVWDNPLGLGIGMGSISGGRDAVGALPVENQVLDTAVQLGVLGAALFVAQYALLVRALRRAASGASATAQTAAFAARSAMLAMLVPLYFQSAFGLIEVSWTLFALAGCALGAAEASRDRAPERMSIG